MLHSIKVMGLSFELNLGVSAQSWDSLLQSNVCYPRRSVAGWLAGWLAASSITPLCSGGQKVAFVTFFGL